MAFVVLVCIVIRYICRSGTDHIRKSVTTWRAVLIYQRL